MKRRETKREITRIKQVEGRVPYFTIQRSETEELVNRRMQLYPQLMPRVSCSFKKQNDNKIKQNQDI